MGGGGGGGELEVSILPGGGLRGGFVAVAVAVAFAWLELLLLLLLLWIATRREGAQQ